ncbi:GyrI-like domain-containing protein [Terrabacter sp. NPDC080008]|uniref:GyrI-like domain-containing protein n=1 Tax=Terrabacter sp. NPDC080008 TaxID=3155176 RepID=UPI00344DF5D3
MKETNEIRVVEAQETPTAVLHAEVPVTELPAFFQKAFTETWNAMRTQGLTPVGPPFALYHGMPAATVDVEVGFPVTSPAHPDGEVEPSTLPGGRAVEALHVGPYDTMGETYGQLEQWMVGQRLRPGSVMWESYLSDPQREPDPATWRTLIHWPVG